MRDLFLAAVMGFLGAAVYAGLFILWRAWRQK